MSLLPWRSALVSSVTEHNVHTRSFFLKADDTAPFAFKPGQFVTFDLPIAERPSQRMRSYSIASAPTGDNHFELVISHKIHGSGSGYLFEHAVPGTELKFRGPLGTFVMPEVPQKPLVLICTGTGIAPFRSYLALMQGKLPETHLVFGARSTEDILYREELELLTKNNSDLHYHITLSRANTSWPGKRGYVHDIYSAIAENGKRDMDFYLCGWRLMVNEARAKLQELGYTKENIHFEVYD